MKTRKILSVILCIATILSLMTCCLMGGASARTYASYETKVNLTFDGEAPYGIPLDRDYPYSYVSATDAVNPTDGGYLNSTCNGGGSIFVGKNGTVGSTRVTPGADSEIKAQALSNLFKFEPSKTYRVSFDYRFTVGTENKDYSFDFRFFTEPHTSPLTGTVYDTVYQYADNASVTGSSVKVGSGWQKAVYVFTVKEGSSPAYLGLRCLTDEKISFDIDNIKIEESTIAVDCGAKAGTLHDMNSDIAGTTVKPCTSTSNISALAIVDDQDTSHGKVLKITASNDSPRVSFDDFKLSLNKKYYISFDAKADVAKRILLTIGKTNNTTGGGRTWINGSGYSGLTLYVDGVEVENSNMNEFVADTGWKHFGVYLDMSNSAWHNYTGTTGQPAIGANDSINLYFGVIQTTGYFDNMQMFEITEAETNKPTATVTADYSARSAASKDGAGIRFRGTFNNSDIENAAEIGFVVATTVAAAEYSDWYKVETGAKSYALTTVCKNDTVDTVYETKDGKTSYQLILTGLKSGTNTAYELPFDVAMYVKDASGNYTYYYLGQSSYNEVLAAYSAQNITMPTK